MEHLKLGKYKIDTNDRVFIKDNIVHVLPKVRYLRDYNWGDAEDVMFEIKEGGYKRIIENKDKYDEGLGSFDLEYIAREFDESYYGTLKVISKERFQKQLDSAYEFFKNK